MFAVGGWFVLFVGEEWDSVANPDAFSMEAGIGHVRQWHRYDKIDIREIYTYTRCSVRHLQ